MTQRLDALGEIVPEPRFARWAPHADPGARFRDALALGGLIEAELKRLHDRARELRAEHEDYARRRDATDLEASQATRNELNGRERPELGVHVRLGGGSGALSALEIEYVVSAARWWPAYTARLSAAATRVRFGIDAFVAQASGEEWSGVALSVATADRASDMRLPGLRSLRIGRAQAAPRRGYRPPPEGLEAMFEGHDRTVKQGEDEREREREGEGEGGGGEAAIDALGSPLATRDPLATRGRFDHRYDAEGTADVPSSATPHRVTIGSAEGEARPRFVAVPREAAEVYREVEIPNPFAAPLLAGPVEVIVDGALLTTSKIDLVDRGGLVRLGLGVEERLRVARNVRVEEGSAGLLGGSTTVDHHVTIDVASSLGHAAAIEVIDQVPVTTDKDLEIKLVSFKPLATKLPAADHGEPLRGGLSWKITVLPGEKQRIELTYRVTLPAKNELVGGNRRE